ncbi:MAG TPA: glycosyl hydrolase family 79 C-terminal domain-containing protein [Solirubrobacteraceae bacterium]|nr:glycosyl hydrolase family 79 C-terminal domain-containing protein [Solirubrobacteraceae bacterium]
MTLTARGGGTRDAAERAVRRRTATAAGAKPPAGAVVLAIGGGPSGRVIPGGFVGLSVEYPALEAYAGTSPAALDPVFVQLIRNLAPGQAPVLRIGGDSTDWTWWPIAGMRRPAGVNYTLTPDFVGVLHALAATLGARLILGVNLEADSAAVATAEARALVAGVGRSQIEGLELGNEPELYAVFDWDGSGRKGRARGYDFGDYNDDVLRVGGGLKLAPLAGPAIGAPGWFGHLGPFLSSHPRVAVATLHRYPLQLCYVNPREPNYPTIAHLLSARSTRGLANSVATSVMVARAHGIPLRIDEMNTISCGTDNGVGRSFASALWALDALFEMARVGVDGVNIHTYPGATYALFSFSSVGGAWQAAVEPEYYGLLMFTQAAPHGSRLENVSETDGGQVQAWATRAPGGTVRVLAINDGDRARTIAFRLAEPHGAGTLERLTAPALTSRSGVTLGGQSFGSSTTTGLLAGPQRTVTVAPSGGLYEFRAPAASADLVTISRRR